MTRFELGVVGFALLSIAGCVVNSRGAAEPMVMSRAADDLDCPQKDIRLVHLEIGNRYRAIGCGKSHLYRTACEGLQCTVAGEDDPAIPWRSRPGPEEPYR